MQKLITILSFLLFFSTQHIFASIKTDSIGVENANGKKVIIHKIEPKETYYAVGRKYNVNPKDIISFNNNKALNPGTIIKVPTSLPYGTETPSVTRQPVVVTSNNAGTHTVKAKENLSQIAEKYNITIAALKQANGLTGNNLSIGQVLNIPGVANTTEAPVTNTGNVQTGNIVEHTVQKKEFLNKIAEQYGTTVDEIKRLNNLSSNNLSIGQVLKVPSANGKQQQAVPSPAVQANTNRPAPPAINTGTKHTVAAGETIFSIAHRYSLTTYQIRQANALGEDAVLSIGQQLNIPVPQAPRSVNDVARENQQNHPDTSTTILDPALRRNPNVYGLNKVEERGTAVWVSDPDLDATKMMVLHRTLKVGSIIMITNPMTNISAFAKVVGKFTENETTKDVIIVITKAVADKLGALDKRFFCNITYAPPADE